MDANGLNGELHFEMAIGDWGTSGNRDEHFGGTPMYASSRAFQVSQMKDLFAFGRIAMELYLDESGKSVAFYLN
jgi:L,D-peptidoglycan transpeptidase YkuD (ErfK/YbiS/YcfS/YnhG family)